MQIWAQAFPYIKKISLTGLTPQDALFWAVTIEAWEKQWNSLSTITQQKWSVYSLPWWNRSFATILSAQGNLKFTSSKTSCGKCWWYNLYSMKNSLLGSTFSLSFSSLSTDHLTKVLRFGHVLITHKPEHAQCLDDISLPMNSAQPHYLSQSSNFSQQKKGMNSMPFFLKRNKKHSHWFSIPVFYCCQSLCF